MPDDVQCLKRVCPASKSASKLQYLNGVHARQALLTLDDPMTLSIIEHVR